ncbi:MAG TPA: hypothetical protein DDW76_00010 [Cyanobacteria bacterium UBA11369]|nr:hypothetical protein [Cyanobacteria bacterium UBA11371]HBE32139.1 hypothetical protein [Cyanobacteria bacterium UBA11368]HBE47229.1 hypothetical protein [Cyanobacteria bacterium UBA11369]
MQKAKAAIALTQLVGLSACWIIGSIIIQIAFWVSVEIPNRALGAARSEVGRPIKNNYANGQKRFFGVLMVN